MIPRTYPSRINPTTGRREALVSFISSTTGLQRWVDYTPVAYVTSATPVEGSYNNNGYIAIADVGSTTGLQAGVDYIRVYLDPGASDAWQVNSVGFIPIGISGIGGVPYALFANNEQGVWYDPSDFSTLFQDSAGTTPVTAVEQPVGLILDKSKGLVLGSELVTNGGFGVDANWTKGTTWTIASGKATANGGSNFLQQSGFSWAVGKVYQVSYTLSDVTAGYVEARLSTGARGKQRSTNGTFTETLAVTATADTIFNIIPTGFVGSIDNISVRELPGNHAFQSTAASRPVLSARVNLLTKTEQFNDAAWTRIGLRAFGSGSVANATTAPDGTTTADLIVEDTTSVTHRVTQGVGTLPAQRLTGTFRFKAGVGTRNAQFGIIAGSSFVSTIFSTVDGSVVTQLDSVGAVLSGKTNSVSGPDTYGFYTANITVTLLSSQSVSVLLGLAQGTNDNYTGDGTSGIYIWGADLRVTNTGTNLPVYQRVNTATDYDTAGFPLYLAFDGTDDWLQTNSINFTSTDKMTVFAGVRKLSDAAAGTVVELSTSIGTNNGSMAIFAPQAAVGVTGYGYRSQGTVLSSVNDTTRAAPITNVLTGIGDISGDSAILRVNGTQAASSTADQGTGNYGNYPLYIGRRGGTTLPFNGRLYSLIVRGASTVSSLVSATESFVATKTGITL